MSTGATSMLASEHQPLAIRSRGDLIYQRQTYQGQAWWLVKDPVSLRYYRLREEACAVLRMLDGKASMFQMKTEVERRFPNVHLETADLHSLVGTLHQYGLVLAEAGGQGAQLYERRVKQRRQRVLGQLASILFLRLPGVDPERFLSWLYPKARWVYSPWCVAACAVLVLSSWLLVILHFHEFYAKLPGFHQFFSAANVGWMMIALASAKILHEIGHGLTCKHYGGECHEIGLLFLVFTPCLYCDTSDSWILPNKWHRAAIGAAGMYVEVVLAAICTFVWWNSEPGLLHYLALNTMFVCSVSTVLFNSNPLLRYDGYYILSDVLEIPNLAQKSRQALIGLLRKWCLGLPWNKELALPPRQRPAFALYAVASVCYRWFILIAILWFLSKVFEPYGLQVIAHLLIALSLIGLIVMPAWRVVGFFRVPGRMQQVNRHRLLATSVMIAMLVLLVLFWPLPHTVMTSVIIQPRDADRVYVTVAGVLATLDIEAGEAVTAGQRLAELEDPDISYQITRLGGERQRLEQHLKNLRRQQGSDADIAAQIPAAQESLVHLQDRLEQLQEDRQRLHLVARRSGTVMPPPDLPPPPAGGRGTLSAWSGTPLDEENLASWLETGTLFCLVGDPRSMEAVLVIDQTHVNFVRAGQRVEIKLDEYPSRLWTGRIEEIAAIELRDVPPELSHKVGGGLNTEVGEAGSERVASASYQARVSLDNTDGRLMPRFRGRAKVDVGTRTLGQAVGRYLAKTFRFN